VHLFNRQDAAFPLCTQKAKGIRNFSGRRGGFHRDTATRQLVHGDFLTGAYVQMCKEILAQRNLAFGANGERAHSWYRLSITHYVGQNGVRIKAATDANFLLTLAVG